MGKKRVLTVSGRYDQISKVLAFVSEGAQKAGMDENAIFHVELCCDEACTNVIEHAYGGEDVGTITISYEIEPDAFTITIQDNGRSFDPSLIPPPPLSPPPSIDYTNENLPDQLQVGGLGIHFMRKLMDEVIFSFNTHGNNTLTMVKKFTPGGTP